MSKEGKQGGREEKSKEKQASRQNIQKSKQQVISYFTASYHYNTWTMQVILIHCIFPQKPILSTIPYIQPLLQANNQKSALTLFLCKNQAALYT